MLCCFLPLGLIELEEFRPQSCMCFVCFKILLNCYIHCACIGYGWFLVRVESRLITLMSVKTAKVTAIKRSNEEVSGQDDF